jgi:hypothetical protein
VSEALDAAAEAHLCGGSPSRAGRAPSRRLGKRSSIDLERNGSESDGGHGGGPDGRDAGGAVGGAYLDFGASSAHQRAVRPGGAKAAAAAAAAATASAGSGSERSPLRPRGGGTRGAGGRSYSAGRGGAAAAVASMPLRRKFLLLLRSLPWCALGGGGGRCVVGVAPGVERPFSRPPTTARAPGAPSPDPAAPIAAHPWQARVPPPLRRPLGAWLPHPLHLHVRLGRRGARGDGGHRGPSGGAAAPAAADERCLVLPARGAGADRAGVSGCGPAGFVVAGRGR